jgi:hypothetical protein
MMAGSCQLALAILTWPRLEGWTSAGAIVNASCRRRAETRNGFGRHGAKLLEHQADVAVVLRRSRG